MKMPKIDKVLETYELEADGVMVDVHITAPETEFVRGYYFDFPEYGPGTAALLHNLKNSIIADATIKAEKMMDPSFIDSLKKRFSDRAYAVLSKELPDSSEETKHMLIGILIHEMLGLGKLEFLLNDTNLEEIVINSATDPVWVYHKKYGWLKTNIFITPETEIQNYASIVARRVGKQITTLTPLLDAHLITGDRVNATLFPISSHGNTITIRRFRRDPITVTDLLQNKSTSSEVMSLIWLMMQYEMNIIISGGTASGKTSFLNALMPFIQPNHRILSLEDTRELILPDFLHWVPLTTREPNPEGKGGISLLDLLVNSLRMRPDRLIVGEIRRQQEAEVLFEGMHTGHSAYTTFHANTAEETIRRMTNPPLNIPHTMLDSVHLNVVCFRNRMLGIRRTLQVAEYIPEATGKESTIKPNILYRWRPSDDTVGKYSESIRLYDEIALHTGLSQKEIDDDMKTKQKILEWMAAMNVHNVNDVGNIMAHYYRNQNSIISLANSNKKPDFLK
jgi:flagellar protein FlaI